MSRYPLPLLFVAPVVTKIAGNLGDRRWLVNLWNHPMYLAASVAGGLILGSRRYADRGASSLQLVLTAIPGNGIRHNLVDLYIHKVFSKNIDQFTIVCLFVEL